MRSVDSIYYLYITLTIRVPGGFLRGMFPIKRFVLAYLYR